MSEQITAIAQKVGEGRRAHAAGQLDIAKQAAEAALEMLKGVSFNYDNLDWRQVAEGDAKWLIGDIAGAEKAFRQAMIAAPNGPGAYVRLADLLIEQQRSEELKKHLEIATSKFPQDSELHRRLGDLRLSLGEQISAVEAYARAHRSDPQNPELADALGSILQSDGMFDEAVLYHARAYQVMPHNPEYAYKLGMAMAGAEEYDAAVELFEEALRLKPNYVAAHHALARELQRRNMYDEAEQAYLKGMVYAPEHEELRRHYGQFLQAKGDHAAAAQQYSEIITNGGAEVEAAIFLKETVAPAPATAPLPAKTPIKLVNDLYTHFDKAFEKALEENQQHRAPGILVNMLKSPEAKTVRDVTAAANRILDLGCGTGLNGLLLRHIALRLEGVDLSSKLLQRAEEKKLYAALHKSDLGEFLTKAEPASYDIAFAADVFTFIGDLGDVFNGIGQALVAKGLFAFSCDALPESDPHPHYAILPTARYAHKESYLCKLAADTGLQVLSIKQDTVRSYMGHEVPGLFMLLGK